MVSPFTLFSLMPNLIFHFSNHLLDAVKVENSSLFKWFLNFKGFFFHNLVIRINVRPAALFEPFVEYFIYLMKLSCRVSL